MRYLAQLGKLQVREHSFAEVPVSLVRPGLFSLFLLNEHPAGEIGSRHLRYHRASVRGLGFIPHCSLFLLKKCWSVCQDLTFARKETYFFRSQKVHWYLQFLSLAPKFPPKLGDCLMSCHPRWLQKPIQVWPEFALQALLTLVKPEDVLFGYIGKHGGWPQRPMHHWPCCYIAVTNLPSSSKLTWQITTTDSWKEISLKGKRNQTDTDVSQSESRVVTHVNQVTIKESLCFTCRHISNGCLLLCLAVWVGDSNADCIQKYQCKVF